jgi:hypothetical protein
MPLLCVEAHDCRGMTAALCLFVLSTAVSATVTVTCVTKNEARTVTAKTTRDRLDAKVEKIPNHRVINFRLPYDFIGYMMTNAQMTRRKFVTAVDCAPRHTAACTG